MAPADKQNLYAVLGVERGADEDAIRKAYRELARKTHPDVRPGDAAAEERFKVISEAYSVLSDPERRRSYDEFGEISLEAGFDAEQAREARAAFGRGFGPGEGFAAGGEGFGFGGLEDLFSGLFSGRGPAANARGADLEADLELDLLEAARGGERRLNLVRPGPGGAPHFDTVTVRIPPGVADAGCIRVRGKGAPGRGKGPPGDLLARVRLRPHPIFRREGRDVSFDLPLSIVEATLGAKVSVPTLGARATLTVPPGTDSGARLRLRGKGFPNPSGGAPGDLYAVVQIRVPRDLSPEDAARLASIDAGEPDRRALEELAEP